MNTVKVAIAQYSSVHLDLPASMKKLEEIIRKAAGEKIHLLVFGETWLSGYPAWLDNCPEVAKWDHEPTKEAYLALRKSSITVPGVETAKIGELAKAAAVNIVIGVNEIITSGKGSGTVFNALLTFNDQGDLVNHHRKLVPTYTEKMIYGHGDAHGLQAVETNIGRVGGLVCWEHWMPLTRQVLHDTAEDIHVAVWPTVHERHQIASLQYAFEGRCFVLAAGQLLKAGDYPSSLSISDGDDPEHLVLTGGSCIINPRGEYIVSPVFNKEGLIMAEIDPDQRIKEQMTLDTSGHYQRPDVFNLEIKKDRLI
ncbi:carbon-nitrogen hydrolase family protein [Fulvivirga sp. M361]|uniref:carbon-nitrogen hydrolase family protein n=1 Tax=Fulvivirga sp. M361 TaxID=2594266 RepID=UPI001179D3B4|nr:carbon-nitrogen hydrolase family protein [Fulvivirga sp. M361]TRX58721.1 carbon-nitrogen hydrolase family protein [Fulvivirga sp. M361]